MQVKNSSRSAISGEIQPTLESTDDYVEEQPNENVEQKT